MEGPGPCPRGRRTLCAPPPSPDLTPLPVGIVAGEGESSGGPVRKPATRLRGLRGRAFFLMQSGVRQPDPPRHLPLILIILSKPGV